MISDPHRPVSCEAENEWIPKGLTEQLEQQTYEPPPLRFLSHSILFQFPSLTTPASYGFTFGPRSPPPNLYSLLGFSAS